MIKKGLIKTKGENKMIDPILDMFQNMKESTYPFEENVFIDPRILFSKHYKGCERYGIIQHCDFCDNFFPEIYIINDGYLICEHCKKDESIIKRGPHTPTEHRKEYENEKERA